MRTLLERVSGEQLAVPDIRSPHDIDILNTITSRLPALGDASGWNIHFGRELNATDDRRHFTRDEDGLPVVEGKHLHPFRVDVGAAATRIPRGGSGAPARSEANLWPSHASPIERSHPRPTG